MSDDPTVEPEATPEGEVWEQKGDTTPGANPPKEVMSPRNPPPPNVTGPNFVPSDPQRIMQHQPRPPAEPAEEPAEEEDNTDPAAEV
jgi:hypothetical protein